MPRTPHRSLARSLVVLAVVTLSACATIPDGRYGITTVAIDGVEQMDEEALAACLATRERDYFRLSLGRAAAPSCGVPPFDSGRFTFLQWPWPWTEWPLFDRSVFERDLQRVERWYRARGFYDAEVLATEVLPAEALGGMAADDPEETDSASGDDEGPCEEDCEVEVRILVREGEPVLTRSVSVTGLSRIDPELAEELADLVELREGERFDEALYDRSRRAMASRLAAESYAHARVTGQVRIDEEAKSADVSLAVDSGPSCVFGEVVVEPIDPPDCELAGATLVEDQEIPLDIIEATALIDPGDRFSSAAAEEAQRAIYNLGAFSSVEVLPDVPEDRSDRVIPVTIRAVPGRICRFGVGVGILSGVSQQLGTTVQSVQNQSENRWDIHLSVSAESRSFLGGLRRLRIEERPRLIFNGGFPNVTDPNFGNLVVLEFRQPSFLEPRTTLALQADWDLGPDPFQCFFRNSIDATLGPERLFLDGRLLLSFQVGALAVLPTDPGGALAEGCGATNAPESSVALFLQQFARLDLRDDPANPTSGFYAAASVQQAGVLPVSSWNFVRVIPETRFYVPVANGLVLAGKFRLGMMFIFDASSGLDTQSATLGPPRFRLRGGGATSVRGYLAGDLGDSRSGGLRQWEASLELRLSIGDLFGLVAFGDAGDVHSGFVEGGMSTAPRFRFDVPHVSPGLGLRVQTPVGPLRFDVGWAVAGAQVLNDDPADAEPTPSNNLFGFPGAIHLTIGEAF